MLEIFVILGGLILLVVLIAWIQTRDNPPRRYAAPGRWYMVIIPSDARADCVDIVARREPLLAGQRAIERKITSIKLNDPHFEEKLDHACEQATFNIQELNSTIEVRTPQGVL